MEAVRQFAGDHPELARYYPGNGGFLLKNEEQVQPCTIFHEQQ